MLVFDFYKIRIFVLSENKKAVGMAEEFENVGCGFIDLNAEAFGSGETFMAMFALLSQEILESAFTNF